MPDQRDGDDLFEDLDKFFAPIRDVDWDDDDQPVPHAPAEEHVEVRSVEPEPSVEPEEPATVLTFDDEEPDASQDDDDDEDWFAEDGGARTTPDEATTRIDPVVVVDEDVEEPEEPAMDEAIDPAQAGLFAEVDDDEDEADLAWEAPTDTSPAPSEEDLEAAAAHFAGSIREEATYETAPIDVMDEGSDLLADLGATPEDIEEEILGDLEEPTAGPRTVVVGAEGISGPSWQDVATVEVGADLERRGVAPGERDVPAAFMTGLVLAVVSLGALWLGELAFAIAAGLAVLVAQGELFGVMVRHHHQPATAVGLVTGGLMMAGAYADGEAAIPAMFALGVLATFLWYMTVPVTARKDVLRNIGLTVLNMAWVPLLAGYLIATLRMDDGPLLVVTVIGLTFLFDTTAFLVGSVWGGSWFQRALAPHISPKKSIEGLIGATLITVVAAAAVLPAFVDPFTEARWDAVILAVVVAIAATVGDLAESLVKRDLQVKDMGSVLPGHGGVLDRIDSLLFVAPAAFLLFRAIL